MMVATGRRERPVGRTDEPETHGGATGVGCEGEDFALRGGRIFR